MDDNSTKTAALQQRIASQANQSIDLNKWIFRQIEVKKTDNILELCCGTGAQTAYFSERICAGTIHCVDLSAETIQTNKRNVENNTITYSIANIDDVDIYAQNKYDFIFSSYGFYYSKDAKNLHGQLKQRLVEGGHFVIVGPVLGNNKELYEIMSMIKSPISKEILYSSERFMLDFLEIFIRSYTHVKFTRVENKVMYKSISDLINYWKNTTFYVKGLEKDFEREASNLFQGDVRITKSIAILDGF